jgi:GntR family uxuAB operon transcriptional repressor
MAPGCPPNGSSRRAWERQGPSVRRALTVLEAEGRISREVGRGTFLREEPDSGNGAAAESARGADDVAERYLGPGGLRPGDQGGFAPADVMTVRRLLEPPAMRLVVAWATAADFEEIGRCLAGGERTASYDEFETWDLALHRSIMAASHSPLLARLYSVIEEARHGRFWGDLKRRSASRERQRAYQADHAELVAALRARDADRAVEAMRAHLARVAGHLFDETA